MEFAFTAATRLIAKKLDALKGAQRKTFLMATEMLTGEELAKCEQKAT